MLFAAYKFRMAITFWWIENFILMKCQSFNSHIPKSKLYITINIVIPDICDNLLSVIYQNSQDFFKWKNKSKILNSSFKDATCKTICFQFTILLI